MWNSFVFESYPRVFIYLKYLNDPISYNIFEKYSLKKFENVIFCKFNFLKFSRNFAKIDERDLMIIDDLKRKYLNQNNHLTIWSNLSIFHSDFDSKQQSNSLNYLLRYPYLCLKDVFNLFFYQTNIITSVFISINCIILTLQESLFLIDLITSIFR